MHICILLLTQLHSLSAWEIHSRAPVRMVYKALPHSQHTASTAKHGLANIIILKKSYNKVAKDHNEKEMRLG